MWIVRLALRRPYTFVVMAMLIAILGTVTITRMPTDIFPEIDIPVVAVLFNYTGIPPEEMETRIVSNFERALVSTVADIEHIESQSLYGMSVTKIFLQPGAKVEAAVAQITAVGQVAIRQMPPGTFPPFIMRYSATNVPIVQISLSSDHLSEQQVFDIATTGLKPGLATVRGVQMPYPYGGKQRQIMVDLDAEKLFAHKVSPSDVSAALGAQNLILPAGTAKIGGNEYQVRLNSSTETVAELNDLPIKTVDGTTIYVRDVAQVRDGFSPQTNIVNVDGKRGVVQSVLKAGASTLEIVDSTKERLPAVLATLHPDLKVSLLADQSKFVRAAIDGVVKEAVLAATLTGLMILLFLGSWRSTIVVITSIPLSILVSIIILNALGHSINVMTLGGMALAVGILVDDATVEIENIHRNLHQKKPLLQAILDGARQIAVPAFVSTLCICIVFIPVGFIEGAARSLFVPLAMGVVFAMLASYILSRTLVPTMVRYLLAREVGIYQGTETGRGIFWRVHHVFNRLFERFRAVYGSMLSWVLEHRMASTLVFVLVLAGSAAIFPLIGWDFFPSVDAGQLRLHMRAPRGTRIEETERWFERVEEVVREVIPSEEITSVIQNIGIPYSGINLALSDGSQMSPAEGEMLVSFASKRSRPTPEYADALREILPQKFPDLIFFFQPPDMVTQVLNFGLPAPIDIQIVGPRGNLAQNAKIAQSLADEVSRIPGAVDVHLQQVFDTPEVRVDVDRTMASQLGLTQRDIASDALIALSSSGQAAPNFWTEPASGVQYPVAVQTPQYRIDTIASLEDLPSTSVGLAQPQHLGNLATIHRGVGRTNVTHYNLSPTFDILASVRGTDLDSVATAVDGILDRTRPSLPRGTTITVRGQVTSMRSSFRSLGFGLVFAVLLVYLLMVINFQSWLEPLIILTALPGAMAGIVWMLFVTGTAISVPALMGAIMSIGVATSNSILMITFANEQQREGKSSVEAAWSAGVTRLRPVIMTALAMIIGMLPMSLGLGEGGEQNAPLGRAVIGGLVAATAATLFFVPIAFSLTKPRAAGTTEQDAEALA